MAYSFITIFAVLLFIAERIRPATKLVHSKYWWFRLGFIQTCTMGVGIIADRTWLIYFKHNPWTQLLTELHPFIQGLLVYLIGSFFFYWWHRFRHESWTLWNIFHQLHHSPNRIETLTAFYVHPIESVASSTLNGFLIYQVLGGTGQGYLVSITIFSLVGLFYHANISVPRFLDYLIQTPNMHRIHHHQGKHTGNYSDLTLWDIVFGTFINPRNYAESFKMGFKNKRELKFWDILRFKNVNQKANL